MVNVSSFLWTSAGQKADGISPPHTHTHGADVNHVVSSLVIPEEFRAITQQVGLPVGVLTVGAMTVGVLTVGAMGRPRTL